MGKSESKSRTGLLGLVMVLVLVAAACGTDDAAGTDVATAEDDRPTIVVTTSIWADVVEEIVGDAANVEAIMPIGADPHTFTASSQQVAMIQTADLVVANGLGLEEGLEDVLEAAAADEVNVLEVAPLVNPIPFALAGEDDHGHDDEHSDEEGEHSHDDEGEHSDEEGEHSHDDEGEHSDEEGEHSDEEGVHSDHGHAHDGDDPHVWMDPDRVALAAIEIAEALTALDASIDWMTRGEAYAEEVRAAGVEADEMLSVVADDQRKLVTNHEALGYFADRFDFEVVGVVFPGGSTLSDPSSAELAELVETMEKEGVTTVFGETSSPSTLAEAVAAEIGDGVQVVELDTGSLGEPGSGAETVIGMTLTNAERVAVSLGG
jgi:zinc/manganese transport system substrate-binding protein